MMNDERKGRDDKMRTEVYNYLNYIFYLVAFFNY